MDSVVLVSAFITEDGLAAELLTRAAERTDLYTAEEILQEVRRVLLEKEHLRKRFLYSDANVERFIETLRAKCIMITSLPGLRVIERDPEDDMVIACAVVAQADYIVSRDLDLLDLKVYRGIQIISPEDFIRRLHGDNIL